MKQQGRTKSTNKSIEPNYTWYKRAPETKRLMKLINQKNDKKNAQELYEKLEETDRQQEEEKKHYI